MKLLFQSDDFGITEAVTLGIMKGIEKGLIRNTGLFVNMAASEFAAQQISRFPQCCFGIDINLVAGKPLTDVKEIPHLVDDEGYFIKSVDRYQHNTVKKAVSVMVEFDEDPFPYTEVLIEMRNQILKFQELVGRNPEYLHPHSLMTPNIDRAFRDLSVEFNIPVSYVEWERVQIFSLPAPWNIKPVFALADQLQTNVEANVLAEVDELLNHEISAMICHAGYIDEALLELSSYSIIRVKDLKMATSEQLMRFVTDHHIELVTYRDLVGIGQ